MKMENEEQTSKEFALQLFELEQMEERPEFSRLSGPRDNHKEVDL